MCASPNQQPLNKKDMKVRLTPGEKARCDAMNGKARMAYMDERQVAMALDPVMKDLKGMAVGTAREQLRGKGVPEAEFAGVPKFNTVAMLACILDKEQPVTNTFVYYHDAPAPWAPVLTEADTTSDV